ncbi:hypothetical protein CBS12448_10755 [Aspergillus niger]|nr:hypothetical protein CBS12448_10755 [Aspergillus niger]KAI2950933.1 hypothetical protein CBS147322_5170 [Aspergillus niger]KAI2978345.1 hypothetical protein CBS147324_1133 [Aspergillus niger]
MRWTFWLGELGLGVPDTSIRTATTPNLASDDQQPRAVAKALLIETEPSRDELWRNVEGKEAIRGDVRNKRLRALRRIALSGAAIQRLKGLSETCRGPWKKRRKCCADFLNSMASLP